MSTPSAVPEPERADCPRCLRLQAEIEVLRTQLEAALAKISALEAELRRGKRQAAPFSREQPKKDPKPPGRRRGKGLFRHREVPPEARQAETLHTPLSCCPECGDFLSGRREHEHFEVDLPPVVPRWRRYVTESGYCAHCKRRMHSRHAEQISLASGAAQVSLGPRAKALSSEMKHRLGVPYGKISDLFARAFGLPITPSALCQADQRLARRAEPLYEEIRAALRAAEAVHVDETGWRIGALSAWLWVFTGARLTLYAIDPRRSHEVIVRVLGRDFAGVLESDCFSAYDHHALAQWLQQKCFAHLLKDLSRLAREKRGGAVRFARQVAVLLRAAIELKAQAQRLDLEVFCHRREEIELALDELISETRRFRDRDNARLAKRLRKQRERLFTFLSNEEAEPTNNAAERALRPAVIVRKTGGCNKTASGARTHAILSSVLVTLRQQGRDAIEYLGTVLQAPGAPPPLLPRPGPAPL